MSLLDNGPDIVDVYPQVASVDDQGNTIYGPSATPVTIQARVQPVTSQEVDATGQQVRTIYRLITRSAPLGPWARVVWNEREWDIVGEPRRYNGSPATRHVDCLLRAREGPGT